MATLQELVIKVTVDDSTVDSGIKKTENKALKGLNGIKKGIGTLAKAGAAAAVATGAAVGVLTKKSIEGYADYEQMVGGVKKLYGNMGMSLEEYAKDVGKSTNEVAAEYNKLEKAQTMVLDNAQKAFKTTGMSANQYMDIATSFSASLINSLEGDTVKAAQQTDVAMRAISDNFNTFGGDLGMIQGAFQGFAKQNYAMLDNLKLGYGGTKSEMERLIKDANEWGAANGKASDLSIESFSDVVTAIDQIQQKQHIAGTTAREAATTIAGSLLSTKAAWENLLTGFADPEADIGKLMQDVVESGTNLVKNLGPAIGQALGSIFTSLPSLASAGKELLGGLMDGITGALPNFSETFGPLMRDSMIMSITNGITSALDSFAVFGTSFIYKGSEMLMSLADGIGQAAPTVLEKAGVVIQSLLQALGAKAPDLINKGIELIGNLLIGIAQALPNIITGGINLITGLVQGVTDGSGTLLSKIGEILLALGQAIYDAAPEMAAAMLNLVKALGENFLQTNWLALGAKAFNGILSAIQTVAPKAKSAVSSMVKGIISYLGFSGAASKVRSAFQNIVNAVKTKMDNARNTVREKVQAIKNLFPLSIGKIFSGLKLPHFSVSGGSAPWGIGGKGSMPSFSVSWYKKALAQPYVFTSPTMFDLKMAGEAGDEMLYGRSALMRDIREAAGGGGDVIINLNYNAADDANDMLRDIARGVQRYKMAGVI